MRSTLYQHAYLDLSGSSALKQQSGGNYATPLGHIILFPSKPVIALSPYYFVISGEATHTNFSLHLVLPGFEPKIFCIEGEHTNRYTTEVVTNV